ncbi:type I restriction-modification enzyme R subunit C-terminal domain-containing protein [Nostoc sp. FACHB-110]|uniref:type I restriction endonuclease subunit R n=1 Tax=Nostoc sp. FACHB-110 TaxID=2692834 RepID=UPI001689FAE2|nr:type I restriction-modification enzyme R subunit C-terminal domain-containing protein [Nostoc sp. FACHB-110]MBD2436580.1 DEAD/DEAH box helicase family protein [Nostoc sp. FACHB-110]
MAQESEWKTRKDRIDKKLRSLNPSWTIIKYTNTLDTTLLQRHAVEEYPTASGPADYALFVNGQLLGIIEAKKVAIGAQNVLEQAKRYSRGALNGTGNWRDYRVPFLYSTNGEVIYFLDVRAEQNISRKISNFHTADALTELFEKNSAASYSRLTSLPIESIENIRPYQIRGVAATEAAMMKGQRAILIAMATGTGKTYMTVAQIYRLLEAKVVQRILFLVDRRALAAQAVRTFASFNTPRGNKFNQEYELYSQRFQREDFADDEKFNSQILPSSYLTSPQGTHTFVYVSTIQRMTINLFGTGSADASEDGDIEEEADAEKLDIPIHAFDLIIADECHRGYTSKQTNAWRNTLDYFDSIKIGLTATPAAHTVSLFKEVVFRYTTEEAIADGYLVDYEPIYIYSNIRIKGAFLRAGEQVGVIDTATGQEAYDQLEDEREYSTEEIEKKITVPDSNRKIIQEIAQYAYKHEGETGRFPRTLIFAVNDLPHQSHADQIVSICKEVFAKGDDFVQKITGSPSVDRPLQKIREFRNRPQPKIAVTVDMLSTGVDIPSIEFIVFMRPVKSRILWVQMLGRGTRLCEGINKTHFKIFDCFNGTLIKYFANTTDIRIEPPRKDPVPIKKLINNIYQNLDRDYNVKTLVKRLWRVDRGMSGEARQMFANYIPNGDIGQFAGELPQKLKTDFTNTLNLLKDNGLQDLLENYPRAKSVFIVAYEQEDSVSSEVIIQGKKPEDYLDSFYRFVQDNIEQIEAIQILLKRPSEWNTNALNELKEKLTRNQFREQDIQRATQLVHNKALADIISMIKRAVNAQEPIYTAAERVDRAIASVSLGKTFNNEQQQWLGYIREHLVQNLTIEINDFEYAPIFERVGGIGRVKKVFGKGFNALINEINAAIVA